MTYISTRSQRIAGHDFRAGDTVPTETVSAMKPRVVTAMLTMGRLEFVDGPAPVRPQPTPEQPVYKGSGWWQWPNGMKARGPADQPPVLTGA